MGAAPGVNELPARRFASFDLGGRVIVVTGGAGLLGVEHAEALAGAGATAVIADVDEVAARARAAEVSGRVEREVLSVCVDVTDENAVRRALDHVLERAGRVDGLVNNAANNPKVEGDGLGATRVETFDMARWARDLDVGLTGAFLCAKVFGGHFAANGGGVIVNVASDLGLVAPDQRIYRRPGLAEHEQPVKPVTYSVVKGGLIQLTRYLATYWADRNVRVNALCPGGVFADQPADFVARLTQLIPLGRMARRDEYRSALVFLCSDAASYMTGANLVMDGGRTCW